MPKENTHLHFANKTKELKNPEIKELIERNISYYNLGSVAPDTFFYAKDFEIWRIADHLHGKDGNLTNEIIFELLDWARKNKDEQILAFTLGYITHCCLDIIFHPIIFYLTGNYHDKDFEKKEKAMYKHRRFEVLLDKKINNSHDFNNSIDKKSFNDEKLLKTLSEILGIETDDIQKAFARQFKLNKLFKKDYILRILQILNSIGIFKLKKEEAFFYAKLDNDLVISEEIEFKDLLTGIVSKKSLNDLFNIAHTNTRLALLSAYRYYNDQESRQNAEINIAGESLDTGKLNYSVDDIRFLKE